jgi:predicted house-cleaning noncanonical NTP pyrophosphatase (MazG superfamily)
MNIIRKVVLILYKYKKFEDYLEKVEGKRIRLTYLEIESIIEDSLPASSYTYKVWWSNGGHYYANAWLNPGWKVEEVNLGNWVDFVREEKVDRGVTFYNKLVRDGIPKIIEDSGRKCEIRTVEKEERLTLLKDKLNEEVQEFLEDNNLDELADIMEVLFGLAESLGYREDELLAKRFLKREERGGFKEGVVLKKVYEGYN